MSEKGKLAELNDTERYILNAIKGLQFGSVEITVHDAQIVQVERSEKKRFEKQHA